MSNSAVEKGNPDTARYAEEKCHEFLRAQTPEEALPALQHVSQLVHKLPDKCVKEVIRKATRETDDGIRYERRYLTSRWIGRFVLGMGLISGILIILCIMLVLLGIIYELPFELSVVVSYILGAFGIEGALATLILHWKQKVVSKNGV